ncbi:MAG: IS110 family transposase [Pseudomonadota bacterium]
MAIAVSIQTLGVDVSRDWLDVFDGDKTERLENSAAAISRYLKQLSGPVQVAIEATQRYHERFVQSALSLGYHVYVVDGYRLCRYRESVGERVKSDAHDARLLHRYVTAEAAHLRRFELPPKSVMELRELLRARAKLVTTKGAVSQSMGQVQQLARTRQSVMRRMQLAIELIEKKLRECIEAAGYSDDARRCESIPGVGRLTATGLVATFRRGEFTSADAFIAFMGMDLRTRESGRFRGQRKLSKHGDPELRRLLFNAARAGARTAAWREYYARLRARGYSTTAAYVALSRKMARVAFALMKKETEFRLETRLEACTGT